MSARAGGTAVGATSAGSSMRWRHRKKGTSARAGGTGEAGATLAGFNMRWRNRKSGKSARARGTAAARATSAGLHVIFRHTPAGPAGSPCRTVSCTWYRHSRENQTKLPRCRHQKTKQAKRNKSKDQYAENKRPPTQQTKAMTLAQPNQRVGSLTESKKKTGAAQNRPTSKIQPKITTIQQCSLVYGGGGGR